MSSTSASKGIQMSLSRVAVVALVFVVYTVSHGAAIKCWECNSKYDSRCGDPFSNFSIALVDCDQKSSDVQHLAEVGEEPPKATLCRKTMQLVGDEVRVVRGCGWIPNEGYYKDRECYQKAGTHHIQVYHCACKEDGCNRGTSSWTVSLAMLLIPLLPTLILRQD